MSALERLAWLALSFVTGIAAGYLLLLWQDYRNDTRRHTRRWVLPDSTSRLTLPKQGEN